MHNWAAKCENVLKKERLIYKSTQRQKSGVGIADRGIGHEGGHKVVKIISMTKKNRGMMTNHKRINTTHLTKTSGVSDLRVDQCGSG